jgi:serine/threonine protein phosphatase 1
MGNHECKHLNGVLSYAQDIVKLQFGVDYEVFMAWVVLESYFHETDEAMVVHAAFEHDRLLTEQKEEVPCGTG